MTVRLDPSLALEKALERIVEQCRVLLTVLKDEQDLLLGRTQGDWDFVLKRKESALKGLNQAESEWKNTFRRSSLVAYLHDPEISEAQRLHRIQSDLVAALHDICALNRENASLLRRALYYNQSFLTLIHGFADRSKSMIYGPQGKSDLFSADVLGQTA